MKPETSLVPDFETDFHSYLEQKLPAHLALHQAMQYSLLNGGKRIRPRFALESAQLVSLNPSAARSCAIALEIVHSFSLVHDDLPSMDNDDFRRGLPTTHRRFGEAQALLAGDALLNLAHQTFLESISSVNPMAFARSFEYFTHSIGEMILGQSEELTLKDPDLNQLIRIQSLKTGALFQASILCPLLLVGVLPADPLFVECDAFARAFGFAFQIADDLDDDEQDRIQGAKNILSLMGRKAAVELALTQLNKQPVSRHFSATTLLIDKLK
jgi:geranylgeranyl diphosphate synthase type II